MILNLGKMGYFYSATASLPFSLLLLLGNTDHAWYTPSCLQSTDTLLLEIVFYPVYKTSNQKAKTVHKPHIKLWLFGYPYLGSYKFRYPQKCEHEKMFALKYIDLKHDKSFDPPPLLPGNNYLFTIIYTEQDNKLPRSRNISISETRSSLISVCIFQVISSIGRLRRLPFLRYLLDLRRYPRFPRSRRCSSSVISDSFEEKMGSFLNIACARRGG